MVPGLASNVQQAWVLSDAARTPLPLQRSGEGVLALDLRGHHPDEHATVIALRLDGALRIDERFLPDADGSVTLAASTAALSGPGLRLEPKGNLGYWTSLDAKATWSHVVVPSDAAYWVDVEYSLAPGEEGGEMVVSIGGAEFSVPLLKPTKGWQDYRSERVLTDPRQLGLTRYGNGATGDAHVHDLKPVTLTPKVGETATLDVVVRAAKLGKSALCNLRSLRLVRSEPVASAASSPSLDRAAIERVSAQWCERMRAKNASDVAACYLNDAILHRVGDAPIAGRAAIEAHLSTLVPRLVAIDVETHDLRGGGDVVVQIGQEVRTLMRNEVSTNAAAALDVHRIDFVRTWRRIGDQDWQLQSDVGWPVK
jgi:ketosteroid isomerase-like protein